MEKEKREKHEELEKKWYESMEGRFFKSDVREGCDPENFKVYRVLRKSWNSLQLEYAHWAHNEYFSMGVTNWYYADQERMMEFYKEITEVEYYHHLARFLKQCGVWDNIVRETNH